jgi:uncharacterized OB-fold protein
MSQLLPPNIGADTLDDPFWDGCRRHEFLLHVCGVCHRAYWPSSTCIDHGWATMAWQPSSGRGVIHTYTVFHHSYLPWTADKVPYIIAVVKLDEGPFFHSDILECPIEDIAVDMPVEAVFLDAEDGWVIPHFRPSPRS